MPIQIHQNNKLPKILLIRRQEKWTLTAQGWVVTCLCIASLLLYIITHVQPFLAISSPIKAEVLVIEGWLPDYALKPVLSEFEKGSYKKIVTTGIPLPTGYYLAEYKTFAELSAATLKALGLKTEELVAVPTPDVIKDRTYASAIAFRQWLLNSDLKIKSINLYTFDVHSRRSWLLFKQALAPKIKVGVIAAKTLDYEPNKWWTSSVGVRSVISETIAYIYARFLNLKQPS